MISCSKISIAAGNMAKENTSQGGKTTEQATASTSHTVVDSGENPENTNNQQHSNKTKGKQESTNAVPYYKLFSFADHLDYLLMFVGTIASVGSGISIPFMTIVFGDLIDSFGRSVNTKDVVHEVSKVICNKNLIIYICQTSMLNFSNLSLSPPCDMKKNIILLYTNLISSEIWIPFNLSSLKAVSLFSNMLAQLQCLSSNA